MTDRATVVHLGRLGAMGERRRVRSWHAQLEAAGFDVTELSILPHHRATPIDVVRQAPRVAQRGAVVPESLAWRARSVVASVRATEPDLLVVVSIRAYHPSLRGIARRTTIDFVDRLSDSYRDRSADARGARGAGYRLLSQTAARAERRHRDDVVRVAAGRTDAEALNATWIPIVVENMPVETDEGAAADVAFIGTLGYPPNIEAVERLARLWPAIEAARPGTTALVAGARPTPNVKALAERNGWTLDADFSSLGAILNRARLSVAPLLHASGMQIKVLDSAAHGTAQVVDPVVLRGFDPALPIAAPAGDAAFAASVVELLDDDGRRAEAAERTRAHVLEHYTAAAWADRVRALLDG